MLLVINHGTRLMVLILSFYFNIPFLQAQKLKKEAHYTDHNFIPRYNFKKYFNTILFQGNTRKKNYFEGWYFKMVAEDGSSIISVIPGISLSKDNQKQHAFIQIINGITSQTYYYTFPLESFSFSKKEFAIKIGNNYFSKDSLILDIQNNDSIISGKIKTSNTVKYKSGRLINPGIMGWYRYVPFMECYHGVASLTHNLTGKITIHNKEYDFNEGKGYIEKDWGTGMPSSWIWMQSNHFTEKENSFMLSIANIPWLGKSFAGFLGFFYHDKKIHHIATYRATKLKMDIDSLNHLHIKIENRKNTILLYVASNNTGMLKAPVSGLMDRRIPESIDATIKITMLDKKGNLILKDSTNIAGLEMVGDYRSFRKL